MRFIPKKQRDEMEKLPFFKVCALAGHGYGNCEGKITWDHPLTFGGPQIIDPNFTVPLCTKHHNVNEHQDGKTYKKELSVWIVLNRATESELVKYSKAINYQREKVRLNEIYGLYDEAKAITAYIAQKPVARSTISRIKPFWVPLSETQKKKVQECIDYYADVHETFYTPFEMIDKMISSCRDALPTKTNKNYVKNN